MSQYSDRSLNDYDKIQLDIDDGDISWAEDDIKSEDDDARPPPLQFSPRNVNQQAQPKVVRHEPQFIMPSIGDGQPRKRTTPRKTSQGQPLRDSRSKTVSARSTLQRRSGDLNRDTTFADRILTVFLGLFGGILDILGDTIRLLKKPISYGLALYLCMVLAQLASNLFTDSIYAAFSPVCRIPGVGYLNLPVCRPYGSNHPTLPAGAAVPDPEFDSLMKVQNQFEAIMEETSTSLSLPADMKRSETYLRDLRQVVRFSTLPSKNELMHEFDGFIETARIASYDLQKFHSHVGRGVDIVLSTARWTSRVLADIGHDEQQQGILPAFISDTILAPFKPLKFTEARALDQYIQHSYIVSGEIDKLVEEAQTLLHVLQNLEDRLDVIHAVALRDNIHVQDKREEILADLWTYLGANQAKKRKLDTQMNLLTHVSEYRKLAIKHIAVTVVKLQEMGAELEELRTRVGSAAVLKEAGITHVPLAVHIDNIQLGVERLEIGRQKARELEQKHARKILDRAEADATAGEIRYISS